MIADGFTKDVVERCRIPAELLHELDLRGIVLKIETIDYATKYHLMFRRVFRKSIVPPPFFNVTAGTPTEGCRITEMPQDVIEERTVGVEGSSPNDPIPMILSLKRMLYDYDKFMEDMPLRSKLEKHIKDPAEVQKMMDLFKHNELEVKLIKKSRENVYQQLYNTI